MATTAQLPSPQFSLAKAGGGLVAVVVGGLIAAVVICICLGFEAELPVAVATATLCLLASAVSLVPVWLLADRGAEGLSQGFMLSLLIRMPLCLGVAVLLGYATSFGLLRVCLWVSGWYLLLLATEVMLLVRCTMGLKPTDA